MQQTIAAIVGNWSKSNFSLPYSQIEMANKHETSARFTHKSDNSDQLPKQRTHQWTKKLEEGSDACVCVCVCMNQRGHQTNNNNKMFSKIKK